MTKPSTTPLWARHLAALLFFSVLALVGCKTAANEEVGGETHWLECQADFECSNGNACLCGLCSHSCEASSDCTGVGPDPECAAGGQTEYADGCEEPGALLCVPSESVDTDDRMSDDDAADDDAADDDAADDDAADDDTADDDTADDDTADDDAACDPPMSIVANGECTTCDDARAGEAAAFDALTERDELFACQQRSDCVVVVAPTPCAPHCSVAVGVAASAMDEFESEVAAIGETWCPDPEFTQVCGPSDVVCMTIDLEPHCVDGRCELDVPGAFPDNCEEDELNVMDECLSCDEVRTGEASAYTALAEQDELFTCDADTDCVTVAAETQCARRCPIGIAATGAEPFLDALANISETWCPEPSYDELCGAPQEDCAASLATCEAGRCALTAGELSNSISGYPLDAGGLCFEREAMAAGTTDCRDGPPVISYALDATGACWMFASGCVPDGFTGAGNHPCVGLDLCPEPTVPDDCASRTVAQCESDEQCVAVGAQANQGDCFGGDLVDVGCIDVPTGCDLALTPAVSPDGTCWLFMDSCVPEGYTVPEAGQCPAGMCAE